MLPPTVSLKSDRNERKPLALSPSVTLLSAFQAGLKQAVEGGEDYRPYTGTIG